MWGGGEGDTKVKRKEGTCTKAKGNERSGGEGTVQVKRQERSEEKGVVQKRRESRGVGKGGVQKCCPWMTVPARLQ